MNQSESIQELTAALSKAQGAMGHAVKDTENTYFNSKYATLAAVLDVIREPFRDNGLCVTQRTAFTGADVILITTLWHSSGQFISGEYPVRPTKNDPQGFGSAMTYARRYTLSAIAGIAQDDDDGNAASGKAESKAKEQSKPPPKKSKKDDPPVQRLNELLEKGCGVPLSDVAGLDRIVAWLSDGNYASHEDATRTDADANAVLNAALDVGKERKNNFKSFVKSAAEWAEQNQLDKAVTG